MYIKKGLGTLFLVLVTIFVIPLFVAGCAAGPGNVSRNVQGQSVREIKIQPEWIIKVPNENQTTESNLYIYAVGDGLVPSFFWIKEKGNYSLDDTERLSALTFLSSKGIDTDSAEVKNESRIMFVYPAKEDAASFKEDKDDVNIIIGTGSE